MSELQLVEVPKISRTRFTYETFGSKKGIVWPTCYNMERDTHKPLNEWVVVGYCESPEIPSIMGGQRPFAIMYECIKECKGISRNVEVGEFAWFHYRKLPKFTSLGGYPCNQ